ncbi:CRISPR-associated protein Cas4 [Emticicia sp. BO119]|uniref:CRISPR-associated protein Cas4 n=1 Tax=Emticicia sp. BO119 TaxID=2757768 RepID=UPI0015F10FAF|nr:CRISPR-associated protein Cas4 [Emticicia sp. BO119]MBA4850449.1 CRISPR-associated protein Cas4 [Emticicia sp. BO119]
MPITATLINYRMLCRRKVWLHAHGIRMEHTSEVVAEGRLIGLESYPQRAERWTEIEVSGMLSYPAETPIELSAKIDFFDPHLGIVHEVKKSAAKEQAHIAQVQFYLYLLRLNGINAMYGLIEYPKLRITERVSLTDEDILSMQSQILKAHEIIQQEACPERLPISKCKSCSFFEFCWVGEE